MYYMALEMEYTGSSPCYRRYPVLVEQSCFEYLVQQTPQPPLHIEQTERERERKGGRREGGSGEREGDLIMEA